jgi:hypothetical protein
MRRETGNVLPFEEHLTRPKFNKANDGFQGGGFTNSIPAQQTNDFSAVNSQGDALENMTLLVKSIQFFNLQ